MCIVQMMDKMDIISINKTMTKELKQTRTFVTCGCCEESFWMAPQSAVFLELLVRRRILLFLLEVFDFTKLSTEYARFQNSYSGITIPRTLSFSNLPITRTKSRFPLLSRTHSQKFRTIAGVTYFIISNVLIGSRQSRKQVTPAPALTSQLSAKKIKIIWQISSLF